MSKYTVLNHEEELSKYISDNNSIITYEKVFDIDLFNEVGAYFLAKHPLSEHQRYIHKNDDMTGIGITVMCEVFNSETLSKLFGEPLYHDEFGEGFEGDYDEELEDYLEPENKSSYASYFVKVNDIVLHIGYDHRGTCFEFDNNNDVTDISQLTEAIKVLIDSL